MCPLCPPVQSTTAPQIPFLKQTCAPAVVPGAGQPTPAVLLRPPGDRFKFERAPHHTTPHQQAAGGHKTKPTRKKAPRPRRAGYPTPPHHSTIKCPHHHPPQPPTPHTFLPQFPAFTIIPSAPLPFPSFAAHRARGVLRSSPRSPEHLVQRSGPPRRARKGGRERERERERESRI